MFIPPHLLAQADILRATFTKGLNEDPDDERLANVVTWLIETFTFKRSLELALAISRRIGADHCVRVVNPDGSTGFALIAEEPHPVGSHATGQGITIWGRLAIGDLVRGLTGERSPHLQVGIAESEQPANAQDEILFRLANLLPWYQGILKNSNHKIDTSMLIDTCLELGLPRKLLTTGN